MIQTILAVIADHFGIPQEQLTEDMHLVDNLGADSLDPIELALDIEEHFDLWIEDEEIVTWNTVGDVLAWAEKQSDV